MPAITQIDVISHPAYKRYIRDTTLEEIERMSVIVCAYNTIKRINERVTRFRLGEQVPAADGFEQYKVCVWSDPHCKSGPDTCVCSYLSGECYDVIKLLDKLLRTDEDCTTSAEADDKERRH